MKNRTYFPALRGRLGDWAFYSVLMNLNQVAGKIKYAAEVHKSTKLSDFIQRELDNKLRAGQIGDYLLNNNDRFFNSLVVAVYGGDPEWHEFDNLRSSEGDIKIEDISYENRYSVGYLSFIGSEKLFAIDGQHRLAGIRNALEKNKNLGTDEVSIIVVAHHTTADGMRRTRKLFTTLNKTAKPVAKSEIIALDEADAMAITARHLVENDHRFNDPRVHILSKQANLPKTDTIHLITLINLYDILEILFTKTNKSTALATDLKRLRPSDEELNTYFKMAEDYFFSLEKISPELKKFYSSNAPEKEISHYRHENGGHILFRPVGLLIFTEIVAVLMRTLGITLETSVAKLKKLPTELSMQPYKDILWDSQTGTMKIKNKALTRDLLLYYFGHIKDVKKIKKLQQRYALLLGDPSAVPPAAK